MSHVAIAEHICPICSNKHTHNTEILIHKRLKDIPKDKRITGYSLCEEHQELADKGYIALVEASNGTEGGTLTLQNAERTGRLVHVKRDVFNDLFNVEAPDLGMIFVGVGVIAHLEEIP